MNLPCFGTDSSRSGKPVSVTTNRNHVHHLLWALVIHVDITQGDGEWTMIRMNVDNLEEAVEFLEARGFHKARHDAANETIDTASSKINVMVSPTGTIISVSQHIKD